MPAARRRELIEQAATSVFAERGYLGASIDEISRRAGVSAPVIYDHFESKLDLYRRLLERTRNELLEVWREHLFVEGPVEERAPKALEAWAAYVESRRVQTRMYFREAAGDPDAEAVQQEIHAQGRVALGVVLARGPGRAGAVVARPPARVPRADRQDRLQRSLGGLRPRPLLTPRGRHACSP